MIFGAEKMGEIAANENGKVLLSNMWLHRLPTRPELASTAWFPKNQPRIWQSSANQEPASEPSS